MDPNIHQWKSQIIEGIKFSFNVFDQIFRSNLFVNVFCKVKDNPVDLHV